jgi:hypothetical protein
MRVLVVTNLYPPQANAVGGAHQQQVHAQRYRPRLAVPQNLERLGHKVAHGEHRGDGAIWLARLTGFNHSFSKASAGTPCMGHRGSAAHPTRLLGSAEDRVGADALAALSKHHQRALRVVVALGLCTPQLKR